MSRPWGLRPAFILVGEVEGQKLIEKKLFGYDFERN